MERDDQRATGKEPWKQSRRSDDRSKERRRSKERSRERSSRRGEDYSSKGARGRYSTRREAGRGRSRSSRGRSEDDSSEDLDRRENRNSRSKVAQGYDRRGGGRKGRSRSRSPRARSRDRSRERFARKDDAGVGESRRSRRESSTGLERYGSRRGRSRSPRARSRGYSKEQDYRVDRSRSASRDSSRGRRNESMELSKLYSDGRLVEQGKLVEGTSTREFWGMKYAPSSVHSTACGPVDYGGLKTQEQCDQLMEEMRRGRLPFDYAGTPPFCANISRSYIWRNSLCTKWPVKPYSQICRGKTLRLHSPKLADNRLI